MKTYLAIYLGATFLAIMVMPLIILIARTLNMFDETGPRKIHAREIPRIGGISIVLAMLGMTVPVLIIDNSIGQAFRELQYEIIILLCGSMAIFLVGLIDDIRRLNVRTKFLAQLSLAAAVTLLGIRIDQVVIADWFTLRLGLFSWPITILWIVGITNAINLIDGLDGLAAGISAIACAVIAIFSIYSQQPVMAVLMLALLGSLTGFLFFNFNPAKIFMGDGGSYFLGFMLSVSSIICTTKSATIVGLSLPALALGVPIFDTLFCMLRRFLERRSMFSPDRGHFHHRLLDMGLHHRHAVLLIYLATLIVTGLGMFMMATRNVGTLIIFFSALFVLLLIFRIFGALRIREIVDGLQRKMDHAQETRGHRRDFETIQLQFRRIHTFDQWWDTLQLAASRMKCAWMILPLRNRDGSKRTLFWRCPGPEPHPEKILEINLPVRQRRNDEPLRLSLAFKVNGSLETAGHRAALFSRLIDEHSLDMLPQEPYLVPELPSWNILGLTAMKSDNDERVVKLK